MRRAAPLLLLLLTAAVYLWRLGDMPVYLAPDEALIANDAYLLATTGRASDGTWLPLYFRAGYYGSWFMPMIYYGMALALQVLPPVEWAIRLPTVLAGVAQRRLDLLRRVAALRRSSPGGGGRVRPGVRAGVFHSQPLRARLHAAGAVHSRLVVVPAHRARPAAIAMVVRRVWTVPRHRLVSYISSMVMMPVYAAMTLSVIVTRKRDWRDAAAFTAGFVLPLTFFVAWLMQHPDAVEATARRYRLIEGPQSASAS